MSKGENRTAAIGLRLTPQLKRALEVAAERDGRSVSSLVERIVTEWLARNMPSR